MKGRVGLAAIVAVSAVMPVVAACNAAPTTSTCRISQLALTGHLLQGAAGDEFYVLALRNTGSACTMTGYPKVVLRTASGHAVIAGDTARGKPVRTVRLTPGGYASTFLHAFPNACHSGHPAASATIALTPPGNTSVLVMHLAVPICMNAVEPMQAGAQPTPG